MSDDYNPYQAPESDLTKPETTVPEGENYTPVMVEHLKNTRPWVLFIAILTIIMASFMVLGGLGMFSGGVFSSAFNAGIAGSSILIFGLVYIMLAGIYVPVIVFLLRYAQSIKGLLNTGKTESIEKALGYQKSFWKYVGILAIVGIGLMIIGMAVAIALTIMNMRSF